MKYIVIVIMTSLLVGCAGMIKSGGIFEAQKALDEKSYATALEYTETAESFGHLTGEQTAKLHYIRAQAYDGLGQVEKATFGYAYIVEQHPDSAYAIPSKSRLEAINSN